MTKVRVFDCDFHVKLDITFPSEFFESYESSGVKEKKIDNEMKFCCSWQVNHARGMNRSVWLLFAIQIVILVLMGLFTTYGPEADAKHVTNRAGEFVVYTTRSKTIATINIRISK